MLLHLKHPDGRPYVRSDANNAYQLCLDVAEAIREEPKRYYQGDWIVHRFQFDDPAHPDPYYDEFYPACGTIACRAGWMTELTGFDYTGSATALITQAFNLLGSARHIRFDAEGEKLKLFQDIDQLFSGGALLAENDYSDEVNHMASGSPEYAEVGARGLLKFAEKWRTHLEQTPIQSEWSIDRAKVDETPL